MTILKNIKIFKNIFITTGITVLFGIYSIYHLYFYINQLENKIDNLKKREIDDKQIYYDELIKMNDTVNLLTNRISKLETNSLYFQNTNQSDLNEMLYNNDYSQCNEEIKAIIKIGDYTCISKDECFEKDSDEDSIKSSVRSRSSSLSWVKKTLFG